MRLKSFSLKNFRGYRNEVRINMSDLTVFVGRNDIGKSTILEALDIFFNDKSAVSPIELADVNKDAIINGDTETIFTAVFDNLPDSIIIDDTVSTTLQDEMLLDIKQQESPKSISRQIILPIQTAMIFSFRKLLT